MARSRSVASSCGESASSAAARAHSYLRSLRPIGRGGSLGWVDTTIKLRFVNGLLQHDSDESGASGDDITDLTFVNGLLDDVQTTKNP